MGCRQRSDCAALIRVALAPDGSLQVSRTLPGRGAWLCNRSPACAAQAARRGGFAHALRVPVPPAAVDDLVRRLAAEAD